MPKPRPIVPATLWLILAVPCLASGFPAAQDAAQQVEPPSPPTSTVDRALAALGENRLEEAISILEAAEPGVDADPRVTALLGAVYVEAGRHAEGLEVLAPLAELENADVAVLYNAGRAAAAMEEYERAQRYLEASVAGFPASPAARELGFVHLRQRQFMAAYLWLRPWCRNHPNDAEAAAAAARCAVRLGRGSEAEELLSSLPTEAPEMKLLWAKALLLKDDAWSALAVVKELAQEPPEALESQVLTLLADVYLELDQPDLAVEALMGKTEGRPFVAVRLARALRHQQKLDEALELLRPFSRGLVEDDPEVGRWLPGLGFEVALEYGRLLAAAGRHGEAVPFLRGSTEMSPLDAQAWRALGLSLDAIGDEAAGREAIERADRIDLADGSEPAAGAAEPILGSDPTSRQLRRARALLELATADDALRIARQEKTLVPEDPRPPLVEAQMLTSLQRRDEALEVMDAALSSFPVNADVHYYRGVVLMTLDRLGSAEESLNRALELSPRHAPALTDMAVLLIKLDRHQEAREIVQRLLAISPDDPAAARLLEQLEPS